ncbi:DNA repair protein [Coprinopsis marcescibilis]|uniref:DNA repair protein REV1 n=1 Tax=Coprinopsis marcescibilis TaxID=230819 RepID=A0A5C3KJ23_COPMA|nr:DNA repair protein [Coprinopsis marcescibilis]
MASSQNSSDYFPEENSQFLRALQEAVLPGDLPIHSEHDKEDEGEHSGGSQELEPPPPAQPTKRRYSDIEDEQDASHGEREGKKIKLFDPLCDISLSSENVSGSQNSTTSVDSGPEPPPPAQPRLSDDERDRVVKEDQDVYGPSRFGNYGQYMNRKRAKLQIQNAAINDNKPANGIFKGLAIYINGWTQPSVQDLRSLIVQHGGVYQPYLDRKSLVTHIITCSLTPAKIREFKNMKVVRPEWLLESVKAGTLLPWRDFVFTPEERPESSQGTKPRPQPLSNNEQESSRSKEHVAPRLDPLSVTDPKNNEEAARMPGGYATAVSNPNAQRAMANPAWRKAHTSAAPDFIEGYYKNSRLHHLATWKSELKELVQKAQDRAEANADAAASSSSGVNHLGKVPAEGVSMRGAELVMKSPTSKAKWKGKGKVVDDYDRVIMHCDFDCFFVAAGLVSRPELKGKPVIVCHSQGQQGGTSSTSEIASCSYEARKFGLKNGMSLQQARRLCPDVVTIPYEFERYKQFSLLFYTVLMSHADDLQAVSVDEALIDVTNNVSQWRSQAECQETSYPDPAKDYAELIRAEIRKATGCEISVGISHNILLARLATRKAKPGGSFHLLPDHVSEYLAPLDIADLHGFGWQTKKKAQEKLGVSLLGELEKKSKGQLIDSLGRATGENLYNAIRGIDDRKLESDKPRKSVSCEINYGIRFENNTQAEEFISQMAAEVKKRLDAVGMVGRSLTLKIMKRDSTAPAEPAKFLGHGPCDVFSKQGTLFGPGGNATSDDQVIGQHAWRMLKSFNFDPKDLRGIGIHVQKLEHPNVSANAPPGQAVLPFKTFTRPTGQSGVGTSHVVELPVLAAGDPVKAQIERSEEQQDHEMKADLPSFSQVDKSVLEALPRDIREELENEYRRRSASPFPAGPTNAPPRPTSRFGRPGPAFPNRPGPLRRSATPNIFPEKQRPGANGFKRIAQQLAPKSRPALDPKESKNVLFAMFNKQNKHKEKLRIRVPEDKLRELGIDPEVFAVLPKAVQDEQLVMARIIKEKGRLPTPPSRHKVLKPRRVVLPPGFKVYRAPAPKARYPYRPALRRQGKSKKEKLAFTETSDVQSVLETWVTTYRHWAPRPKDVEYLSKFILQCADATVASDDGLQTAVAVMKWWIVLLRRFWPGSELIEEGEPDGSQTDRVGQAWWDTFREVKAKVDVLVRNKYGGSLSLK